MIVRKIIETKQIKDIVTVDPSETVATAAQVLAKHRIGAVVVSTGGGKIDGILSERDIVKALGTMGVSCMTLKVRDLMTSEVVGCRPEETANSVLERMTHGRFRHMPVVEGDAMVGVISIGDVVKARISEIQEENSALTGMIANTW